MAVGQNQHTYSSYPKKCQKSRHVGIRNVDKSCKGKLWASSKIPKTSQKP